jgi:hypothetical protein
MRFSFFLKTFFFVPAFAAAFAILVLCSQFSAFSFPAPANQGVEAAS